MNCNETGKVVWGLLFGGMAALGIHRLGFNDGTRAQKKVDDVLIGTQKALIDTLNDKLDSNEEASE